jgi:hypothetical protein
MDAEFDVVKGRAIWLEEPADCAVLAGACVLPNAAQLLDQIAQQKVRIKDLPFAQGEVQSDVTAIRTAWRRSLYGEASANEPAIRSPREVEETVTRLDQGSGLVQLFAGLELLHDIWAADDTPELLRGVLMLPEQPGGEIEFVSSAAALLVQPGSLVVSMVWKSRYAAAKWGLGVALRRGRVPSQISADIVKDLRKRRSNGQQLSTTSEISRDNVSGARVLIVFLHGLMSTDVGLFDRFVEYLRADSDIGAWAFAAFPHDTCAPIDSNAQLLLNDLEYLFEGNRDTKLAFVCHSRGGLLARKVATELYEQDDARWRTQLVGCVTFGTPHDGTPLAEHPERLLGAGVMAIRLGQPGGLLGAGDVLSLVQAYGGKIPGIDDLKPPAAVATNPQGTIFVNTLRQAERTLAQRSDCRLSILAIGGRGPHESRLGWVTNKLLRGEHDCAVEVESSAPDRRVGVKRLEVNSDHFSYFSRRLAFAEAAQFLKGAVGASDSSQAAMAKMNERFAALRSSHKTTKTKLPDN